MAEKNKILLVDDEKDFLELVRERLEMEGYEIITALDGEEGIAKAKSENPDIIICDIKMPKMDGYEVLKRVRQDQKNRTPFIMLTAYGDFDNLKKAYEEEGDFFVTKPVKLDKLVKNVKILLNLTKNRA